MDHQTNALFIGGIKSQTNSTTLSDYFSKFGKITEVVLKVNQHTGRNKGYGFIYYENPECLEVVQKEEHIIDGRKIDCELSCNNNEAESVYPRSTNLVDNKLFIKNLPDDVTDEELEKYFEPYGELKQCYVVKNQKNGKSRGFGFIRYG